MSKMDKVKAKLANIGQKQVEKSTMTDQELAEFCSGDSLREEFIQRFKEGSPIFTNKKASEILLWIEEQLVNARYES